MENDWLNALNEILHEELLAHTEVQDYVDRVHCIGMSQKAYFTKFSEDGLIALPEKKPEAYELFILDSLFGSYGLKPINPKWKIPPAQHVLIKDNNNVDKKVTINEYI